MQLQVKVKKIWDIFNLKYQKTVERTYLDTGKQQTTYHWCFYILKC